MNKLFIAAVLFFGTCLADIQSRGEALFLLSDKTKTLEIFDRLSQSWVSHKKSDPYFNLEKLLKAVEIAAEQGDIQSQLEITELLWNEGSVRNVNVLAATLLLNVQITNEAEMEALFGLRALYILKEASTIYQNEQEQFEWLFSMSTDGQVIKLAQVLHQMKTINIPSEKAEAFYHWAEEQVAILGDANPSLKKAIQLYIEDYSNSIIGPQTVNRVDYYYHQYDEDYREVTYRSPILNNGSEWKIEEKLYNKLNLFFKNGQEIVINRLDRDTKRYEMIVLVNDGSTKRIVFEKQKSKLFLATYEKNVSVLGSHKITNLVRSGQFGTWFNLENDYRKWYIDSWLDKKTLKDGDTVEITPLDEGGYLMTPQGQKTGLKFRNSVGEFQFRT